MKKVNWRDVWVRAVKTFAQAAIADLTANLTILSGALGDSSALRTLAISVGVGALAAGISAVWNGVISPLLQAKKE